MCFDGLSNERAFGRSEAQPMRPVRSTSRSSAVPARNCPTLDVPGSRLRQLRGDERDPRSVALRSGGAGEPTPASYACAITSAGSARQPAPVDTLPVRSRPARGPRPPNVIPGRRQTPMTPLPVACQPTIETTCQLLQRRVLHQTCGSLDRSRGSRRYAGLPAVPPRDRKSFPRGHRTSTRRRLMTVLPHWLDDAGLPSRTPIVRIEAYSDQGH